MDILSHFTGKSAARRRYFHVTARARSPRVLPSLALVLAAGLFGYWLIRQAAPSVTAKPSTSSRATVPPSQGAPAKPRPTKKGERDTFTDGTTIELFGSCRPEEVILHFPTPESFESFVDALDPQAVRVLGMLERLSALRLGFSEEEEQYLVSLFRDEDISIFKELPSIPTPPRAGGGATEKVATSIGAKLLPWLGVTGDNSRWGNGVKIAVLDTGVVPHQGLPAYFSSIEIVPFPEDLATTHPHGTAVASMIAGSQRIAQGVAPAVSLISVRVADESGMSDDYFLSAGLLAAMDAGAEIVNISMGGGGGGTLLSDAVALLQDKGILIVAAAGNNGETRAKFPAAYPGVVSVGAVDASGERMAFSNIGSDLGMTAPGYGVNAASSNGGFISISGTSASSPIVAGAIAATMADGSGRRLGAREAAQLVMSLADDEGPPGFDPEYGSGVLNLGRVMNRQVPGIHDAVVTWQAREESGDGRDRVRVTIQNRGTSTLINTRIETTTPSGSNSTIATTIAPGASESFSLPVILNQHGPTPVTSTATLGNSAIDTTPANNHRTDVIVSRR